MMKRIYLIAVLAICAITVDAQVSFGGQIGANLAMGNTKYDNGITGFTNDPKIGFLVGVVAEAEFGKLSFRPELNFIQKGSKSGYTAFGFGSSSQKLTLNYIELPLNVVYNLNLGGDGNKLFFGLGPALAFGISGKDKYNDGITVESYKVKFDGKKDADVNDNDSHLKRTDIGLNILAGYKLSMGAFAKIGYTHGFSNINPNNGADDPSYKNRGVSICVGYMLGGKKKK